jgi:hypothetical protein
VLSLFVLVKFLAGITIIGGCLDLWRYFVGSSVPEALWVHTGSLDYEGLNLLDSARGRASDWLPHPYRA